MNNPSKENPDDRPQPPQRMNSEERSNEDAAQLIAAHDEYPPLGPWDECDGCHVDYVRSLLARIAAVEAENETLRQLARDYYEYVPQFCPAKRPGLTADGFTVVCSLADEHDGACVFVEHDILRLSLAASPTPTGPEQA